MNNLCYRKAKADDLSFIIALLKEDELGNARENSEVTESYKKAFHLIDSDPNQYLMVVEHDHKVIGTCHLTLMPSLTFHGTIRLNIEAVRVSGEYRGKGVGSRMLDQAVSYARKFGAQLIQLTTNKKRVEAKRFYEKYGFEPTHEGMKLTLIKTGSIYNNII